MKRLIPLFLALLLLPGMLTACTRDEEIPDGGGESSRQSTNRYYTDQEAADHNSQLDESEINLIQFQELRSGDVVATIKTNMGEIVLVLYPDQAPQTVENFVTLAREGYYNGKIFHRSTPGFAIYTGSLENDGAGGKSIYAQGDDPGYIPDEITTDLWHFRGAVAMEHDAPDQNLSQFYIVQMEEVDPDTLARMEEINFPRKVIDRYREVGGIPALDGSYTVFGMVLEGMEVVDAINAVPVDQENGFRPTRNIVIETVTIEELN